MFGVVNQCLAALRKEPFKRSEMISQPLFGETFEILEEHREWYRVRQSLDDYEGWIDSKLCQQFDDEQMGLLTLEGVSAVATRLFTAKANTNDYPIRLCPGSTLYNFNADNGTFGLLSETFKTFNIPIELSTSTEDNLINLAESYVNSPYLWGGRSPYGIDCSGLTQVIFKMIGISLPRDASQQVGMGNTVDFINLTRVGDLAFFDDEEGNIIHVGIVLPDNKIIHSSGYVKIDVLDQQGIFNVKHKRYSHKLRVIKRILDE
ncbi:MAG: C40 family peptidase [Bacteroidales bacterium]|nr:C40 family peptidase [Bacteroidales bacterium]MDY0254239.1 C40 family peptidase [Tenuifilaceae bacterium]